MPLRGKWKFLILWNLASGPRRFGELRRLVAGVSQKMLIQELKEMVADGVAVRLEYREVPPKVELPAYRPGNVARGSLKPALRVGK